MPDWSEITCDLTLQGGRDPGQLFHPDLVGQRDEHDK
jgi:hypothetical protein